MAAPVPDGPAAASLPWLVPPAYEASAASLAAHSEAIGEVMAGRARLWLGPFPAPDRLPAGLEDTALVVPTSGSTGSAKAVALSLAALTRLQAQQSQITDAIVGSLLVDMTPLEVVALQFAVCGFGVREDEAAQVDASAAQSQPRLETA